MKKNIKNKPKLTSFLLGTCLVAVLAMSIYGTTIKKTEAAYVLGASPAWYEMPPHNGFTTYSQFGAQGIPTNWEATTVFLANPMTYHDFAHYYQDVDGTDRLSTYDGAAYAAFDADNSVMTSANINIESYFWWYFYYNTIGPSNYFAGPVVPNPPPQLFYKDVTCPAGQVMTGARDYEWANRLDEEHVDARCVSVSGITLGASAWVVAPNANTTLWGGYKTATCAAGQIMTGVRMYGVRVDVDEEHVDAYCTAQVGATLSGNHWVSAPNAWVQIWNGYKTTPCPAGEVAVGVRYYEFTNSVDEEHTDVMCAGQTAAVNVWFN